VKRLFEEQGFTVETIENENSRNLKSKIEDFLNTYGYEEDTRLLLYYAGHGHTLKLGGDRDMGYIVPVDAPDPNKNTRGFQQLAIPMQQFDTWAKMITSRHVLFIFDSCFSGSVFATSRAVPGIIDYKIANPVRQFIASGAADETVPDKSVFRTQLEAALRDRGADVNQDGYVSGTELGDFLQSTVVNYSYNSQHPQYGKIRDAALDKGDFVFVVGSPTGTISGRVSVGNVEVTSEIAGRVIIDGTDTGMTVKAGGTATVQNVATGSTDVAVRSADGQVHRASPVMVRQGQTVGAVVERPVPDGFVKIPGGTFMMGSPASEAERSSDETQHRVTVSGFYMSRYEVTQREYEAVMGTNPSYFKGANLPVEQVSWFDAVEYCNARSRKEGLTPAYTLSGSGDSRTVTWNRSATGYRLPTEAEWEYACRAGTTTRFSSGDNETSLAGKANVADLTAKEKYTDATVVNIRDGYAEPAPVGSFAANPFGLYDMHGNVWEWCWDWFGDYSSGAQTDPMGASSGSSRVWRGGGWNNSGQLVRSAFRIYDTPSTRYSNLGVRLLRPSL
jgi:formylglycine-generating enzyme required for sulfatase activity